MVQLSATAGPKLLALTLGALCLLARPPSARAQLEAVGAVLSVVPVTSILATAGLVGVKLAALSRLLDILGYDRAYLAQGGKGTAAHPIGLQTNYAYMFPYVPGLNVSVSGEHRLGLPVGPSATERHSASGQAAEQQAKESSSAATRKTYPSMGLPGDYEAQQRPFRGSETLREIFRQAGIQVHLPSNQQRQQIQQQLHIPAKGKDERASLEPARPVAAQSSNKQLSQYQPPLASIQQQQQPNQRPSSAQQQQAPPSQMQAPAERAQTQTDPQTLSTTTTNNANPAPDHLLPTNHNLNHLAAIPTNLQPASAQSSSSFLNHQSAPPPPPPPQRHPASSNGDLLNLAPSPSSVPMHPSSSSSSSSNNNNNQQQQVNMPAKPPVSPPFSPPASSLSPNSNPTSALSSERAPPFRPDFHPVPQHDEFRRRLLEARRHQSHFATGHLALSMPFSPTPPLGNQRDASPFDAQASLFFPDALAQLRHAAEPSRPHSVAQGHLFAAGQQRGQNLVAGQQQAGEEFSATTNFVPPFDLDLFPSTNPANDFNELDLQNLGRRRRRKRAAAGAELSAAQMAPNYGMPAMNIHSVRRRRRRRTTSGLGHLLMD